ncbi:MAG: hypothetical protein IPN76_35520 [Saprospiraceae bacterium]|nr:hypothetical protein [Saprospiraceae bacterium]
MVAIPYEFESHFRHTDKAFAVARGFVVQLTIVSIPSLLLPSLLALLAEILGTVGGFGASLFFVPVPA